MPINDESHFTITAVSIAFSLYFASTKHIGKLNTDQ